ncbi:MAG: N-acetyltransferase [Alphaproteobacteria bacterium]|nr:N-acetyltransferase [Alphaproteobacteria bacterium]
MNFSIVPERPFDAAAIEMLLQVAFGPDRHAKTVYKLREGVEPLPDLAFVALDEGGVLQASIRYWPILIDRRWPAVLLGPLAVNPVHKGRGMGKALMRHSLAEAARLGHRLCLLVGDHDYYAPFGFVHAAPFGLKLPGWVDLDRFHVRELVPGAMAGVSGMVGRAPGAGRSLMGSGARSVG